MDRSLQGVAKPGAGLCPACAHVRLVRTPRSEFLLCERSRSDSRFERYPRQPVAACPGFEAAGDDGTPPGDGAGRGPRD